MSRRNVAVFADHREQVISQAASAFDEARITLEEAVREAHVSATSIRRAYRNGHLRVQRLGIGGRVLRIRRADLFAWLEAGGMTGPDGHAA